MSDGKQPMLASAQVVQKQLVDNGPMMSALASGDKSGDDETDLRQMTPIGERQVYVPLQKVSQIHP